MDTEKARWSYKLTSDAEFYWGPEAGSDLKEDNRGCSHRASTREGPPQKIMLFTVKQSV